jgi:hypothetical protein
MSLLALALVATSLRYFAPGMPEAFQPELYVDYSWVLRGHIAGGMVAILTGPMQFWSGFRDRHRAWHRALGYIYLGSVAVGFLGGLLMSTVSYGGLVTHVGFGMMAIAWGMTTFVAFGRIRDGDWRSHREWMIRSFATTFGFVTLRIWKMLMESLGAPELDAYQTASWLCWVTNLIVAELYIGWWRSRSLTAGKPG